MRISSNYQKFKLHAQNHGSGYAFRRGVQYLFFLIRKQCVKQQKSGAGRIPEYVIARGPMQIVCADCGLRILWNNAEVTAGAGLNVSVNTLGLWTDSTHADWRILERKETSLQIKVIFKELPLSQTWVIEITEGHQISLDIDVEIEEWLHIDEFRMLCLVSPRYKNWLNNFSQQDFPRQSNDWQDLCLEGLRSLLIGVRFPAEGEFLPSLVLEPQSAQGCLLPLVQNPPANVPAHIIGLRDVLAEEKKEFYPGTYHLFSGRINLYAKECLLDNKIENLRQDYFRAAKEASFCRQREPLCIGKDLKSNSGKIVFPPEIKKITSSTVKGHPEIIRYEDYKELDVIGRYDNPDQRKYPPQHSPDGTPCIYLCGDNSEVHRWGVDLDESAFFKQIDKLKELSAQQKAVRIIVGVRRTNFHRLHHICNVIFATGNQHKKDLPVLDITPLRGIKDRFYKYLSKVSALVKNAGIDFRIVDSQLDALLTVIEKNAQQLCFQENNFLRALGVVCKDVFTGPAFILLDLAGRCNVDCVYCRRFSPFIQKAWKERHPEMTGFLDFKVVRNILVEAKEMGVEAVLLVGGGEPTIHPKFFEIINLIKSLGMDFNFSTNGTVLDEYNKYLLDGRCESVTVSLSFASPESYKMIRPYSNPQLRHKIEKGVRNLADLKKECMVSLPRIIALYAVCKYNYKEIVQMALHAKKLGADKIWYQLVHLEDFSKNELFMSKEDMENVRQLLKEAKEVCDKSGLIFEPFINFEMEHYDGNRGDWSKAGLLQQGCFVGWHFVFIHLNLEVFMCCGRKTLGVLDEQGQGLKDLWSSDVYRRYRNDGVIMHKENPLTLLGSPLYEAYCDSCDNHDQNEKMIAYIKGYALEEFLER